MKNLPDVIFLQVLGSSKPSQDDDYNELRHEATHSNIRVWNSDFSYVEKSKVKDMLRLAYSSGNDYDSFNEFIEMATDFKDL